MRFQRFQKPFSNVLRASVPLCDTSTATFRFNTASGKYVCSVCGYVYDPEVGDPTQGIAPGTPFEALPDDWHCPRCKQPKSRFNPA